MGSSSPGLREKMMSAFLCVLCGCGFFGFLCRSPNCFSCRGGGRVVVPSAQHQIFTELVDVLLLVPAGKHPRNHHLPWFLGAVGHRTVYDEVIEEGDVTRLGFNRRGAFKWESFVKLCITGVELSTRPLLCEPG